MASISKNAYIDRLDDLVNKLNNIYNRNFKMEPVDVKSSTFNDFNMKKIIKALNSKLVIS